MNRVYLWNDDKAGKRVHIAASDGKTMCSQENGVSSLNRRSENFPAGRRLCKVCPRLEKKPNRVLRRRLANAGKAAPIVHGISKKKSTAKRDFAARASARPDFLYSRAWREVRYRALVRSDGCCECCGRSRQNGIILHVDHIKPRSKYPGLALALSNLQVLCEDCNLGKSAWDETDWREPRLATLMGESVD